MQPDDPTGQQDCAAMGWAGRSSGDFKCDKKYAVMCQRPHFGEVGEIGGWKLLYSTIPLKYEEAKHKCKELGGKLTDKDVVDEVRL